VLIMRHTHPGSAALAAKALKASVVNAGDGMHEHPTQGLLDLFTIRESKGGLQGLQVAVIGDIAHSRVARSDIWGLTKMGAQVRLCGPATMLPRELERLAPGSVKCFTRIEEAVEGADVVNMLRLQLERQKRNLFPSTREYSRLYCLTSERLRLAKPGCLVLHPGPMNRGIEISSGVADGPQSAITEQVTNGVAVRMAVLYLLAGSENPEAAA
jgi:aspartate carbamoyltransferase catalytic subunit